MERTPLVCLALLVVLNAPLHTQDRLDVPPIPPEEQLRPRSDLEAVLRITPDVVRADQTPAITIVLRNTGRERLLIPSSISFGVTVRTYQASGEEIVPTTTSTYRQLVYPVSIPRLLALEPQEAREFTLRESADRPSGFAVGEYQLQATYHNFADSPMLYDVYEDGAAQAWEGDITTSRASLTVLPLEADAERQLIARVEDVGDPQVAQATYMLGVARSRNAAGPLVRRFEVDPSSRLAVALALANIGDSEGIGRLAEVIDRLLLAWRGDPHIMLLRSNRDALEALVLQSRDCDGLPILIDLLQSGTDQYRRAAASLDGGCPSLRSRLHALVDAAPRDPSTLEQRVAAARAGNARSLLQELDRRSASEPIDRVQPSEPLDVSSRPAQGNRIAEYVRTIVDAPSGSTLDDELYGIALFGTASTFLELREALDQVTDDRREQVAYALQILTFTSNAHQTDMHLDGEHWDAWWAARQGQSRREWALDALNVPAPPWQGMAWRHARSDASNALAHLARLPDPPRDVLSRAETHRSWRVRVEAALAVAETDLPRGVLLLARELNNRYVAACRETAKVLSLLLQQHRFSCHSLAGRATAVEYWTDAARAMAR